MPLPTFIKSGNSYSPFTFEKARLLPLKEPIIPNQDVGISGGGTVRVADLGEAELLFDLIINRISETNRNNLLGFLQHSTVNYAQNTFTFTNEENVPYEVRIWNTKQLDFPLVRGGFYNVKLTLRQEITNATGGGN